MNAEARGSPLALIDLGAALLAAALWYLWPELAPLPLLLLLVGFVVRHFSDPPVEYELTALDAAVALFLASAGIGLLIAYNWNVALEKFYVIVGAVGIYGALVRAPAEVSLGGRTVKPINLLLAVLPTAIAAYYVATADYSLQAGKLPLLDGLFTWISSWQPVLPGHKLHPNVAGGLVAALLPLQVLVLAERAGTRSKRAGVAGGDRPAYRLAWHWRGIETVLVAISVFGLALSASRGAWAALAVVALGCALTRWVRLRRPGRPKGEAVAWAAGLLVVAVVALGWAPGALAGPEVTAPVHIAGRPSTTLLQAMPASRAQDALTAERASLVLLRSMPASRAQDAQQTGVSARDVQQAPPTALPPGPALEPGAGAVQDAQETAEGRAGLFWNSLALAWDTALTGLGLGGFQMAFSTYVLLLHVGHTFHSHNLFLNVWLEQGLLGLAALVWLLAAAVVAWRRVRRLGDARGKAWACAALAAIAVMVLHGLVDDAFYGSRGVLLMFVPFALLTRVQADAVWAAYEPPTLTQVLLSRKGIIAAGVLAAVLLIGLTAPVRSQVQASLGALAQTRAELSVYQWPTWPIQDALRRGPGPGLRAEIDLDPAIAHYETALRIDPNNATANRRLGQIVLARGDYPTAEALLTAAYRNGYTNRAARQLYGEVLALQGQPEAAASVWGSVDLSQGQIDGRLWWYKSIGEMEKAGALAAARR